MIGVAGVFITNAVYDLLYIHLGLGPVTSTTIATIVATITSYLGNRYWSFQDRRRTGVPREIQLVWSGHPRGGVRMAVGRPSRRALRRDS